MRKIMHALPGGYLRPIVDPSAGACDAWDAVLVRQDNASGELSLCIDENNPEFYGLCTLRSELVVMDDSCEVWRGRITSQELEKHWIKRVVCKGLMDYLYDGIILPQTFQGSAQDVLAKILQQFNASADARKHFAVGTVAGIGQIDYELKRPTKCFKLLSELIKLAGGSLKAYRDGDRNTLDWRAESTEFRRTCSQKAVFGENIAKLSVSQDGDRITTVLFGFGKDDITFSQINDGDPFVVDEDAQKIHGRVEDSVTFSGVTDPQELLQLTKNELQDRLAKATQIDATAIDASASDSTIEPFEEGLYARLYSEPHGIDELVMIRKIEQPLFNASKMTITLGTSLPAASTIMRRAL